MTHRDTPIRRMGISVAHKFRATYPNWMVALIVFSSLLVFALISFLSLIVWHGTTLTSLKSWNQMQSSLEYYANVFEHPWSILSIMSDERSRKYGTDEKWSSSVLGRASNHSIVNPVGKSVERTKERQSRYEGIDKEKALMGEDPSKLPFTCPPLTSCSVAGTVHKGAGPDVVQIINGIVDINLHSSSKNNSASCR